MVLSAQLCNIMPVINVNLVKSVDISSKLLKKYYVLEWGQKTYVYSSYAAIALVTFWATF